MAKIETTFIRPKEEFNVDTGKAKVTYDGFQNNPHEIVLEENLDGEVDGIINETFKENDNNNVVFKDDEDNEHELITDEGFGDALNEALPSALANAQVITTTWHALKDLRDNGQLIAGSLYRITDYNCTTTQENTRSAGHQFDIVLLALSENKLAEEGWAMMNESNIYDVTFNDGVIKKCWLYDENPFGGDESEYNVIMCDSLLGTNGLVDGDEIIINENNKTVECSYYSSTDLVTPNLTYNYFQNSNLSAWKVWYCLDNDTDRFAWADDEDIPQIYDNNYWYLRDATKDIEGYFAWYNSDEKSTYYTKTINPNVGTMIYSESGGEIVEYDSVYAIKGFGRGVIYRLIDEFNNDVAYDFKNIQYIRPLTDGGYDEQGANTWCYTFNRWNSDNSACVDATIGSNVFNCKIEAFVGEEAPTLSLGNNVCNSLDVNITDIKFIGSSCGVNTLQDCSFMYIINSTDFYDAQNNNIMAIYNSTVVTE